MRQTFVRRSILGLGLGGVASTLLLSSRSQAATMRLKAALKGSSEVPPNTTTGTGTITATYDPVTKELSWKGTYSGLTGDATAAYFHGPAEAGKNAGVAIRISTKGGPFPSSFEGKATLTDAQAADLQNGLWYANIYTAANPGGELRGQLMKA
jgi:CHRD domain-containing protein